MSSPPVSKQTPFPTSVTFGCAGSPQVRSMSRGARDGVAAAPTAWIRGKPSASASPCVTVTAAPWRAARSSAARASSAGPHGVGGRIDEVAGEIDAVGDADDAGAVGAGRDHQARAAVPLAVAGVAVGAEGEGEGGEAIVGEAGGEAVVAGGEGGGEPAGEERRPVRVLAETEEDESHAAFARRGEERSARRP